MHRGDLYGCEPPAGCGEWIETLCQSPAVRIERIVTRGQITPPGQCYDQDHPEWVVLLAGWARLEFAAPDESIDLRPGQWVQIPAGRVHRIAAVSSDPPAVWLAVHYDQPV